MSLAADRAALAVALDTAAGVFGYTYPPSVIKAGDAWPLLAGVTRGPGHSWLGEWRVLVALSADAQDAATKTDTVLVDVSEALDPVAFVDAVVPVALETSAGVLHALEFRCRTEA
jgi:hypothetical protein